jgi:hypothetical protein
MAKLKITPEHLERMRALLTPLVARKAVSAYRAEHPEHSEIRILWDYWNSTGREGLEFTCHTLYAYLNDDHITSALRTILL